MTNTRFRSNGAIENAYLAFLQREGTSKEAVSSGAASSDNNIAVTAAPAVECVNQDTDIEQK
jgi:hypothetical protein